MNNTIHSIREPTLRCLILCSSCFGAGVGWAGAVNGNVGNSAQIWSKQLGNASHAVLFISTGPVPAQFSLPYLNISSDFAVAGRSVCLRDLYTKAETGRYSSILTLPSILTLSGYHIADDVLRLSGPFDLSTHSLDVTVQVHDSVFFCVRLASKEGTCESYGCPSFVA